MRGRRQHQRMGRDGVGLGADGAERERDALPGAGLDHAPMHAVGLGDAAEPALEILRAA